MKEQESEFGREQEQERRSSGTAINGKSLIKISPGTRLVITGLRSFKKHEPKNGPRGRDFYYVILSQSAARFTTQPRRRKDWRLQL
jgi:hypothetical protein